uniref:AlNc14C182G8241 protein n=1 Tax=Albugo laibachii Nc14 TaxID=890382 RepID=F0WP93_9STRA|nr:AlNc14C182G8241 [Albugo laibachii Nc14]|eukprot:CCA23139.1 AlNc14C182G8241 [Albugo laibachii Nc14]
MYRLRFYWLIISINCLLNAQCSLALIDNISINTNDNDFLRAVMQVVHVDNRAFYLIPGETPPTVPKKQLLSRYNSPSEYRHPQ